MSEATSHYRRVVSFLAVVFCSGVALPASGQFHSADTTPDYKIGLTELLRVVQLHNWAAHCCQAGTEDGYAPGAGDQSCGAHDSDYAPQDWSIDLSELLRLVQLFNAGSYHAEEGTEDGYAPASRAEMVSVPSGSFPMGNLGSVALSAYQIGKHEVTNAEYAAALNWALVQGYLEAASATTVVSYGWELLDLDDPDCQISYSAGEFFVESRDGYAMDAHPVVEVSWYGAAAYCNWRSEMEGLDPAYDVQTWGLRTATPNSGYRLPTEAEWERSAAWDAASSSYWDYGYKSNSINPIRCNYDNNNPLGLTAQPYTTPAGYYNGADGTVNSPSPVGAYDMTGNVWEWCQDWYGDYPEPPLSDPTGPGSGLERVIRGGGWATGITGCRSDYRLSYGPFGTALDLGFRLAKSAVEEQMVLVLAGTFEMSDVGSVTLSSYLIGQYEVTNGQFVEALNRALSEGRLDTVGEDTVDSYGRQLIDLDDSDCQISYSEGQFFSESRDGYSMADHPVLEVTWYGAVAYCNWLSEWKGLACAYDLSTWEFYAPLPNGYRLPTEAEWERAAAWDASNGTHWDYAFPGGELSSLRCNYHRNNPLDLSVGPYTVPVGYYNGDNGTLDSASPVGAYDMAGNAWEWCHDWSGDYPLGPVTDPRGPEYGYDRVIRGGGWATGPIACVTDFRLSHPPYESALDLGFRMARSL